MRVHNIIYIYTYLLGIEYRMANMCTNITSRKNKYLLCISILIRF